MPDVTRTALNIRTLKINLDLLKYARAISPLSKKDLQTKLQILDTFLETLSPSTVSERSRQTCYVRLQGVGPKGRGFEAWEKKLLWLPIGTIQLIKSLRGFKMVRLDFVPGSRLHAWVTEPIPWSMRRYVPVPLKNLVKSLTPFLGSCAYFGCDALDYFEFHRLEFTVTTSKF